MNEVTVNILGFKAVLAHYRCGSASTKLKLTVVATVCRPGEPTMAAKIIPYLHQFTVTVGVLVAMRIRLENLQNWRPHLHIFMCLWSVFCEQRTDNDTGSLFVWSPFPWSVPSGLGL